MKIHTVVIALIAAMAIMTMFAGCISDDDSVDAGSEQETTEVSTAEPTVESTVESTVEPTVESTMTATAIENDAMPGPMMENRTAPPDDGSQPPMDGERPMDGQLPGAGPGQ